MSMLKGLACALSGWLAWSLSAWAAAPTPACGADLPPAARHMVSGPGYVVAFAPTRWPVPVGQHFSLNFQVCPDGGQPAVDSLRVDADMPLHKHGMNYRTTIKPLGDGRYRADGLMFHMPGRWRVVLDLNYANKTLRLSRELEVQ